MILTRAEYRRFSGDEDSYDGDVEVALAEVQIVVERYTGRKFELGTYTERIPYYGTRVYPSAVPVASVTSPSGTRIDGYALELGYFGTAWGVDGSSVEVTYTGGFAVMPPELKRIVARIVYSVLHPAQVMNIPSGATSISVGPVSISGKNLKEAADHSALYELCAWRKVEV